MTDWSQVPAGTAVRDTLRRKNLELVRVDERGNLRCVDPAKRGARHVLTPERAELLTPAADPAAGIHWERLTPGEYRSREAVRGAPARILKEHRVGWWLEVYDEPRRLFASYSAAKEAAQAVVGGAGA